jgi:hypothetical protein
LIKVIAVSNVLELGAVAEVHSVQDLLESCAQFVYENLDVLENDWKKKLKSSPMFLMSIVEFMKSDRAVHLPEVSRFGSVHQPGEKMWVCKGVKTDAISFQLSHAATLISLGLYGNMDTESIPVKISVSNNSKSESIFTSNTSYKSTGTDEPVRVPVKVKMVADTEYTISVVIKSSNAKTYYGSGNSEVSCGGKLKVVFKRTSESTNKTGLFLNEQTNKIEATIFACRIKQTKSSRLQNGCHSSSH